MFARLQCFWENDESRYRCIAYPYWVSGQSSSERHVGSVGHPLRTSQGMTSDQRRGEHDWGSTSVEAVFLLVEAYHLEDHLGKRIPRDQRFVVPRIPALVELCIQDGVDLPEYPAKRQRKPIIKIGRKEFVDANEDGLPDPEPDIFKQPILQELPYDEISAPSNPEEMASLAEETLEAWETVRDGALKRMKSYAVRVFGYTTLRCISDQVATKHGTVEPSSISRGMDSMDGRQQCSMT